MEKEVLGFTVSGDTSTWDLLQNLFLVLGFTQSMEVGAWVVGWSP